MSQENWDDILKEKVSEELRHKTMARARTELDHMGTHKTFSLSWLIPLVPALAALLFFIRSKESDESDLLAKSEESFLKELENMSISELDDFDEDLVANLDFYENLDLLEDWDESGES
jgi:hypothetical protein